MVILDVGRLASSYTEDGLRIFWLWLSRLFKVWAVARAQPIKGLVGKRLCVAQGAPSRD